MNCHERSYDTLSLALHLFVNNNDKNLLCRLFLMALIQEAAPTRSVSAKQLKPIHAPCPSGVFHFITNERLISISAISLPARIIFKKVILPGEMQTCLEIPAVTQIAQKHHQILHTTFPSRRKSLFRVS
jgi:hypothetical protein